MTSYQFLLNDGIDSLFFGYMSKVGKDTTAAFWQGVTIEAPGSWQTKDAYDCPSLSQL